MAKKQSSKPAWELSSNRELTQAQNDIANGNKKTFEEMKSLIDKYQRCPSSLNHHQDNQLESMLMVLSTAPSTDPEKQKVIAYTSGDKNGKNIAQYLQNPRMAGKPM